MIGTSKFPNVRDHSMLDSDCLHKVLLGGALYQQITISLFQTPFISTYLFLWYWTIDHQLHFYHSPLIHTNPKSIIIFNWKVYETTIAVMLKYVNYILIVPRICRRVFGRIMWMSRLTS